MYVIDDLAKLYTDKKLVYRRKVKKSHRMIKLSNYIPCFSQNLKKKEKS